MGQPSVARNHRDNGTAEPTGKDFFAVAQELEAIAAGKLRPDAAIAPDPTVRREVAAVIECRPNVPLSQSDNENARKLTDLDRDLTFDLAQLSPAASSFARRRPFLLSEAISRECRSGYMPGQSKSSLRGQWVYGIQNQQGEPLAWVGRNVKYDEEYAAWVAGGRHDREPMKYRFPSQALFRRGLELYGQEFLSDERFSESRSRYGLLIVEGFNDRLRLHELGVLSVAMMSNRITDEQSTLLARYAKEYGCGRVGVMHDANAKGDEGAKEILWRMHEQGINAYLVWSRGKFDGRFGDREPENLGSDEWAEIAASIAA